MHSSTAETQPQTCGTPKSQLMRPSVHSCSMHFCHRRRCWANVSCSLHRKYVTQCFFFIKNQSTQPTALWQSHQDNTTTNACWFAIQRKKNLFYLTYFFSFFFAITTIRQLYQVTRTDTDTHSRAHVHNSSLHSFFSAIFTDSRLFLRQLFSFQNIMRIDRRSKRNFSHC